MPIFYDENLEEPPPADRLRVMISALSSGSNIDATLRKEIIDALKVFEIRRCNDEMRRKRGRDIDLSVLCAAAIAKQLIDQHGAKKKSAITAASKSVMWKTKTSGISLESIEKRYQYLNKSPDGYIATAEGGKFGVYSIGQAVMDNAIARLKGETSFDDPHNGEMCIFVLLSKPTIDD